MSGPQKNGTDEVEGAILPWNFEFLLISVFKFENIRLAACTDLKILVSTKGRMLILSLPTWISGCSEIMVEKIWGHKGCYFHRLSILWYLCCIDHIQPVLDFKNQDHFVFLF
jgi:hypothetical protein